LHCYVRDELTQKYGAEKVPPGEPIPAHLLGNMWSQEWGNIYPIVAPYPDVAELNVSTALQRMRKQKEDELLATLGKDASVADRAEAARKADEWIALEMVHSAENFYKSMGMGALTESFWDKSMFVKP